MSGNAHTQASINTAKIRVANMLREKEKNPACSIFFMSDKDFISK